MQKLVDWPYYATLLCLKEEEKQEIILQKG